MRLTKTFIQEAWDKVLSPMDVKCDIHCDKHQNYKVIGKFDNFSFTLEFYNFKGDFHFSWFSGDCNGTLLPYIYMFLKELRKENN